METCYRLLFVCVCVFLLLCTVVVQWDVYVECHRHICLGACVNDEKHMYICVSGHIIDCIGFIWSIYFDIVASYVHTN